MTTLEMLCSWTHITSFLHFVHAMPGMEDCQRKADAQTDGRVVPVWESCGFEDRMLAMPALGGKSEADVVSSARMVSKWVPSRLACAGFTEKCAKAYCCQLKPLSKKWNFRIFTPYRWYLHRKSRHIMGLITK